MSALREAGLGLRLPATVSHITCTTSSPSCCCLHLAFLQTVPGTLKLLQVVIGSLCDSLLASHGLGHQDQLLLGHSALTMLTTVAGCLWVTSLLLICYVCSSNSYKLIRSSMLELLVGVVATLSLLSASLFMCLRVELVLYPIHMLSPVDITGYPVLAAAYMLGFVLTVLYALDTYHSYRFIKGYR